MICDGIDNMCVKSIDLPTLFPVLWFFFYTSETDFKNYYYQAVSCCDGFSGMCKVGLIVK